MTAETIGTIGTAESVGAAESVGTVDAWLAEPPFACPQAEKERRLFPALRALTAHHAAACPAYRRLLTVAWPNWEQASTVAGLPYLPVDLFRSHGDRLASVPAAAIRSWVTSSGTSGRAVSRIPLDDPAVRAQALALTGVLRVVLGPVRLPMLIIDRRETLSGTEATSARAAGILGVMKLGREYAFALDAALTPDMNVLTTFLARHGRRPFLVYGTTAVVWKQFHQELDARGLTLDLGHGVLIHGGGWKKLADQAVDRASFRAGLARSCGLTRIHDFYGMAEQIGTVFLEGEDGLLYPPVFADVIIRDPETWHPVPPGQVGVIQVVSLLPRSYPGHLLVTGDLGVIEATDPAGGWSGHGLRVLGRVAGAPVRGCGAVDGAVNGAVNGGTGATP